MTDLAYILASFASRKLPPWLSDALAVWVADVYLWSHPARARAVSRRLRRVWVESPGPGGAPTARETHRAFALAFRDFLATGTRENQNMCVRLDDEGRQILLEARASGRSTLLVSGHFGPWEVALQWLAQEVGSMDALARTHRHPAVERFFASRRAAFGVRTLSDERPAAAAIARLRAGGWIAALVDRGTPGRSRATVRKGERYPGGLVRLDSAPLLLARRARAQILAGVAWRASDGAAEVRFHPPFTLQPWGGGIALRQAEARLQHFFDAHVRAHPTQWFDWSVGPTVVARPPAAGRDGKDTGSE